ncbi:methionine gamma-lyase [Algimonas porphyrae]|uniref:L-methionine gamma-lyase n=1 Tax=Algimonas porphyrae TaxID=1128113 RepID=A0ABQ5V4T7_9PROT|nr:methionine gamma-lyase [Algimonas porphyrae]GLQ21606.1 methionine gamma-lyase [Algimonas porphyrae]
MRDSNSPSGFATRAIHHGYDPLDHGGSLAPPVHMTSTFVFGSADQGGAIFAGEAPGHVYSRISNPTLDLLEQRMASLEGAEAGLATGSGIGAITASLWTILQPGDEIIVDETLYGCTFSFLHHGLEKFGVIVTHCDLTEPDTLRRAISNRTKVVYFETPANPNMRLVDIDAIAKIAKSADALVMVDNTYATPVLTRPIERGADLVVHSATKYLGGHGDLVGGIVVGCKELIDEIRLYGLKDMTGAVMAPMTAMLILRGLKTLELRMERHCSSAQTVAEALASHPAVASVLYPGLSSFAQRELADLQMTTEAGPAYGGMIALELHGGIEAGKALIDGLSMIHCAVSLGDAETLIQHPASMTHSPYTPEERIRHGISDGLVRLSVGLEAVDDIIADLIVSLDALSAPSLLAAAE